MSWQASYVIPICLEIDKMYNIDMFINIYLRVKISIFVQNNALVLYMGFFYYYKFLMGGFLKAVNLNGVL